MASLSEHVPIEIHDMMLKQLLEMDDDDKHEFSRGILDEFFEQVAESIPKFAELLEKKEYKGIAQLGHFLKGSAANVGATTIRNICEKLNHITSPSSSEDTSNVNKFIIEQISLLHEVTPRMKTEMYKVYDT